MPNSNDYNHPLIGLVGDDQLIALNDTDFVDGLDGNDTLVLNRAGSGTSFTYNMAAAATASGTVTGGIQVQNVENIALTTGGGSDTLIATDPGVQFYFDARGGLDTLVLDYSAQADRVVILRDAPAHGVTVSSLGVVTGHAANIDSLWVSGGVGDDILTDMRTGDDRLSGGFGDDALLSLGGADVLDGGAGTDYAEIVRSTSTLSFTLNGLAAGTAAGTTLVDGTRLMNIERISAYTGSGNDVLYGTAGADILNGGAGTDHIWGAAGDDVLTGAAGDDWISGGIGNDALLGGDGIDTLIGGLGNDTYRVGESNDLVREGNHGGTDTVYATADYSLGGQYVENLLLRSTALNGSGNGLANTLAGTNADNNLWGLGGTDRLFGAAGNDRLDGGLGADTMYGGAGDDIYIVDNVGDFGSENQSGLADDGGMDKVSASVDVELWAYVENLALTGFQAINGTGNNLDNGLTGNSNVNRLDGGKGDDTLRGMQGNDVLVGGEGNDVFWFDAAGSANGTDRVSDFGSGMDRLAFMGTDYGVESGHILLAGELSMTGHAVGTDAQFIYNGNNNTLYWDADGTGTQNARTISVFSNGASVAASDFIFL